MFQDMCVLVVALPVSHRQMKNVNYLLCKISIGGFHAKGEDLAQPSAQSHNRSPIPHEKNYKDNWWSA